MKRQLLSLFALSGIILAGCTVGFDAEQSGTFSCSGDQDCLSGYECRNEVCVSKGIDEPQVCTDRDNDGYGSGNQLASCPNPVASDCFDASEQLNCSNGGTCPVAGLSCGANGRCQHSGGGTIPSPKNINPGAQEICDGLDNDCDGQVDEPVSCQTAADCPPAPSNSTIPECKQGQCILVPPIRDCSSPNAPQDCDCPTLELTCSNGSYQPPIDQIPEYCY